MSFHFFESSLISLSLKSNHLKNNLSVSKSGSRLESPHSLTFIPASPLDPPNTHIHTHTYTHTHTHTHTEFTVTKICH